MGNAESDATGHEEPDERQEHELTPFRCQGVAAAPSEEEQEKAEADGKQAKEVPAPGLITPAAVCRLTTRRTVHTWCKGRACINSWRLRRGESREASLGPDATGHSTAEDERKPYPVGIPTIGLE